MKQQLTILFFLVQFFAFGQVDTVYLDAFSFQCKKDNAKFYRVIQNKNIHYSVTEYYIKTNKISMSGQFLNSELDTRIGTFNYYDSLGNISKVCFYANGNKSGEWLTNYEYSNQIYYKEIYEDNQLVKFNVYFKDGKLKREEIYNNDKRTKAECYDSLGNVIPFYEFQVQANYKGGLQEVRKFLAENIVYPKNAVELGLEGKTYIRFNITENGEISDVNVIRGILDCPECDEEAIRVVKLMKDWEPAMIEGKPITSTFTLPVQFILDFDTPSKKKKGSKRKNKS